MEDRGKLTNPDESEILPQITFDYDAASQRGHFVAFDVEQWKLDVGGPYRLRWDDGRWAEILISKINHSSQLNGSIVNFVVSGAIHAS